MNQQIVFKVDEPIKVIDAIKQTTMRCETEMLGRHGLELHVQAMHRTGPADWAERFPGSSGAIYGWPTHGWRGSFRRSGSRSKLRGLYLAGGTVHPGPGIPMALQSGRIKSLSAGAHKTDEVGNIILDALTEGAGV